MRMKSFLSLGLVVSVLVSALPALAQQTPPPRARRFEYPAHNAAKIANLTARAEAGEAHAQYELGTSYNIGNGVKRDHAMALTWYHKAAAQGYPYAQYSIGLMYRRGEGVAQDDAAAVSWYRKAADQGTGVAQYLLGTMYEKGLGVPKDYVQAYMWYDLSVSAAGTWNDDDIKAREAVAALMSPEEVADAQALARAWKKPLETTATP